MIRIIAVLLMAIALFGNAEELIKWENDKLIYNAKLSDEGTSFHFKFKNISDGELEIEKIKSSCSCMSVKSKFPFKVSKGGEGVIEVYYDFTGKVGLNRGNVEVTFSGKRVALNLEVDIPVPVTIAPRFLIWKKGERDPREIQISVHPDWKGKILDVKSQEESIKAEISEKDGSYKIKVTPPSEEELKKKRTHLILNGSDEEGKHKEYRVYLILN